MQSEKTSERLHQRKVSIAHRCTSKLRWLHFVTTCKLPRIRLESVLRGASIAGLQIPLISDHYETPSLYEQVVVGLLVRVLKPKRCFEIGTSLGLTTNILAMNSDADCQIDTLDVSSESRIGSAFRGTQGAAKIRQHIASSLNFRFDAYKGQMDLIFVDGSHEVQDVVRDTQHSISMLSSKGVALWHDVSPDSPGVVKALEASASLGKFWRISDTSLGLYTKVNSLEDLWQA
jgi:hypothetical protein